MVMRRFQIFSAWPQLKLFLAQTLCSSGLWSSDHHWRGYSYSGTQAEGSIILTQASMTSKAGEMMSHVPELRTSTLKWHITFSYMFKASHWPQLTSKVCVPDRRIVLMTPQIHPLVTEYSAHFLSYIHIYSSSFQDWQPPHSTFSWP